MDIAATIEAARAAQASWGAQTLKARLRVIARFRHVFTLRMSDLQKIVEAARPRPPGEALASEILPVAETCAWLQNRAPKVLAPRGVGHGAGLVWRLISRVTVSREPHGVVLIIGPSNYPLGLAGVQALHALTAGNAVIWKPGRGGEASARAFCDITREAALPPSLLCVLDESADAAQAAIRAGVDKVVLTGSASTGSAVLEDLASRIVPATMELSGCDAVFVLPGADLDLVVRALRFGMRFNDGATCIGPHRLFASSEILTALEPRLTEACREIGPCRVDPAVAARVRRLAQEAVEGGARLLTGDLEDDAPYLPILLADASPGMQLLKADTFAPVLSIVSVQDEEDALEAARVCPYALGATVFGPARDAEAFAGRVPAGFVIVNDMIVPLGDPRVPFGGRGRSGFGVTRGAEGLLEMTRIRTVVASRGRSRPHLDAPPETSQAMLSAYMKARHAFTLRERLAGWLGCLRVILK